MDNKLLLAVNFLGVDKLSGSIRKIVGAGKLGAASMKAMRAEAKGLESELKDVRRQIMNGMGKGGPIADLVKRERELALAVARSNRVLGEQNAKLNTIARVRGRLNAAADRAGAFGAQSTIFLTAPLLAFAATSVNAAREASRAMAQTRASIASMGATAGRTFPQLQAQAERLMKTSLFDDDEILNSVTANLLTFGQVHGAVFDRAQQAVIDYSSKTGKDLLGATIMLGKALNDPIKGLNAMGRVGIAFSDSQKKMIKSMVAAGNAAGAQGVILAELEKQYGGSGKAARAADPTAAAAIDIGEFQQAIGEKLLPRLIPLVTGLSGLLDKFNALSPSTQSLIVNTAGLAAILGPAATLFGGAARGLSFFAGPIGTLITKVPMLRSVMGLLGNSFLGVAKVALRAGMMMMANPIVLVAVAIAAAAYLIYTNWDSIGPFFSSMWNQVYAAFTGPLGSILTVLFPFLGIPIKIYQHWGDISAWFRNSWNSVVAAFNDPMAFFDSLPAKFGSLGGSILSGLLNAIPGGALAKHLISLAQAGLTAFKNFFGIKSPSRVFMGLGGYMTEGLALGLDRGGKQPLRSLARISAGLTGGAALAIASPAFADSPAGNRGGGDTASSSAARSITYNVTIQLASTGDAKADAEAIKRELDALLAVEARGSYLDE